MNLQRILNSKKAGIWALRISRILPPSSGLRLASFAADQIAKNHNLPLVKALRLNRWVVSGCSLSGPALDEAVRRNLSHIAGSYYILFHYLNHPEELQGQVEFTPEAEDLIASSPAKKRGIVVAGLHMSNFDLVMQAAAWRGLKAIAISLPDENENQQAVEWQHKFRRQSGLEILPASISVFRQAIRRLRDGEIVMTGVDRPIPNPKVHPYFFDKPASLPIHYAYLAQEANVPLVLICANRRPDGIYHIKTSAEIRMRPYPDRQEKTLANAERVLEAAEEFICQAPEQWCIYQPIWPELQETVP
jgi:KDO2-lipid IV(A) lauroyltransferase